MKNIIKEIDGEVLPSMCKVDALISFGAEEIEVSDKWEDDIVVVVENTFSDSAFYIKDKDQLSDFIEKSNNSNQRFTWLRFNNAKNYVN